MRHLLPAATLVMLPTLCVAQTTEPETDPIFEAEADIISSPTASSLNLNLEPYVYFGAKSDLDGGGEVGMRRAGWKLGLSTPISERWEFNLEFINEYSFPDISSAGALGGGDPFNTLIGAQLLPAFTWKGPGKWAWRIGGRIEYAAEAGADVGESFIGGVFASFRRQETPTFSWGFGAAVFARFDDSFWIIPLPAITWKVSDTILIYSERVGVNVQGTITEDWFLTFKARWEPREYRLTDDATSVLPGGVLRDDSVLLGVELAWRPRPNFEALLEVGGAVYQKYELLDSSGDTQFDDNADPAPYIAARLRFTF